MPRDVDASGRTVAMKADEVRPDATNLDAVVRPLPGAGLVVRAGDMLMVCADQGDGADDLLALFAQTAAGGADGSALVRKVAALLASDETGRYPPCAISGPSADGRMAVLVYGDATAGMMGPDGPLVLSGADAITSLDRLVPGPVTQIRLELPGAGTPDPRVRLESGVVFGAGVVVESVGFAGGVVQSVGSAPGGASVGLAPGGGAAADLELPPRQSAGSGAVDLEIPPKQQGFGAAVEAVGSAPGAQESVGGAPPAEEAVGSAPDKPSESGAWPKGDDASPEAEPEPQPDLEAPPPVAKPFTMEPPQVPRPLDPYHASSSTLVGSASVADSAAQAEAAWDYEKPPPPPPPFPVSEEIGEAPPEPAPVDPYAQQPTSGAPETAGVMVLDDGSTFRLDIDYVIGREPQHDPDVVAGAARALKIEDAEGVVSRKHLRVTVAGSELRLIDLGSANGTFVQLPGDPQRLQLVAGQPAAVPPGTLVTMGRRWLRLESDPTA
jgi:hypothetical protein